ncbi:MAG TPA: RluA family pseudouridine synthase [Spirochaetales bacterium]|nr:RluA family pseudouridine synthase [Spirochaetales bacterium]HRY54562.1 RluA family pseudouridine synthase [Spirochaetia bacterium]HRZ65363.1 RluA family pseudouridine synthase [Spirochaetia bacterium]
MPDTIPVLFSDESILAVDKPAGMLSIPDRYDPEAPVASAALAAAWGRLYAVHRIDKDTSGVLVYARSAEAHRELGLAFESRAVRKVYRALVRGLPDWEERSCELPLRADGDREHRTVIDAHKGKSARTDFAVVQRFAARGSFGGAALVEARPETGRTHQIRVHLAALGFPCLCDPLYGDGEALLLSKLKRRWKGDEFAERPLLARAALHALSIEFAHPATGRELRLEAELPKDLRASLAQLGKL